MWIHDFIVEIGDWAFYGCSNLKLTGGVNVAKFGKCSFSGCSSLTGVWVDNCFEKPIIIENAAFADCTSLSNIELRSNNAETISIGSSAFFNTAYYNNKDNWENGVLYIDEFLIRADENLVSGSYSIKSGTKAIAVCAFDGCEKLTDITIPYGVSDIPESAFYMCKNLKTVSIPESVTNIGLHAFENCVILNEIEIPDYVTRIDAKAFDGAGLKLVEIPASVEYIGNLAFSCSNLKFITVSKDNKYYSNDENGVLFDKNKTKLIQFPAKNIINENRSYTIPNGVINIEEKAFLWSALKTIVLPESVTKIGDYAFSNCFYLENINIPSKVEKICSGMFDQCPSLKEVVIPYGVTLIEYAAFSGCENLECVHIPSTVTTIEENAFDVTNIKSYICSDSSNCYASDWAYKNGVKFKLCTNHGTLEPNTPTNPKEPIVDPSVVQTPSESTINYGDSIVLYVDKARIPQDGYVVWIANNENFNYVDCSVDGTGSKIKITPQKSGTTVFVATVVDAEGNEILRDEQIMTSKAGLFQKFLAFFKRIFGLTKNITE